MEELTSDSIFYVQDAQQSAPQDSVTFYISDGSSQTEAFSILMDIQVCEHVSTSAGCCFCLTEPHI